MLKKNFVISEKTLERWGFYGWDTEKLRIVTEKDAKAEYQDNKVILKFENYVATPFVVHINNEKVERIISSNDVDILLPIIGKEKVILAGKSAIYSLQNKLKSSDYNIVRGLYWKDYKMVRYLNNIQLVKDAYVWHGDGNVKIDVHKIRYLRYYIDMKGSSKELCYENWLEMMDTHAERVLSTEDFVVYADSDSVLVVPTEKFILENSLGGDFENMVAISARGFWSGILEEIIAQFYSKFGKGTKYLMYDRSPAARMSFGERLDTGDIVHAWKGKCIYDHEGIELYELPYEVKILNSMRLGYRNRGQFILNYDIKDTEQPIVLYRIRRTGMKDQEYEIVMVGVITLDGKTKAICSFSDVGIIDIIAKHVKNIVSKKAVEAGGYVLVDRYDILRIAEVHGAWNVTIEALERIAGTGYAYVVKKKVNLKEYIRERVADILLDTNEVIVVLRNDNVIQAILSPGYVKQVLGVDPLRDRIEYEIHISEGMPTFKAVNGEIVLQSGKSLSTLIKEAIEGAKNKVIHWIGNSIPIEEVIKGLKQIPDLKFTYRDSILAGNCKYGTKKFIEEELQGKEYLTLDEMLQFMKKERWEIGIDNILRNKYKNLVLKQAI